MIHNLILFTTRDLVLRWKKQAEMIWCNFGVYFSVVSIVLVLFASKLYTQSINGLTRNHKMSQFKLDKLYSYSLRNYSYPLANDLNSVACGFKNFMGQKVRWNFFSSMMATLNCAKLANMHSRWE